MALSRSIISKLMKAHPGLADGRIPAYLNGLENLTENESIELSMAFMHHPELIEKSNEVTRTLVRYRKVDSRSQGRREANAV